MRVGAALLAVGGVALLVSSLWLVRDGFRRLRGRS